MKRKSTMAPPRLTSSQRFAGIGQDIDSIKHHLRKLHWQMTALITFFKVNVPADSLDEMINPSESFLNKVITEARFASYAAEATKTVPVKKRRRRKAKKHK